MFIATASAAALKKDLLALALKHSPGSLPVDGLRRVLDAANLVHATEHMRYLMVKDARMPGGFAELDHTSSNGSKLKGEAGELSTDLQVTSFSDVRLLNGVTEIEATVVLQKCELHFKFRRQPKAHGTSMPRHGLRILVDETPGWIDLDEEEEGGEDEQEEDDEMHTATLPSFKKKPTTVVEYTISATNLSTPANPRHNRSILVQVLLYGFHPSGTPSPLGVIDPSKHEEDGRKEGDMEQQRDVCTVAMCDVTLEHAIQWAGTALSSSDFLSFLFLFPYHEEEWDIGNLALDQLLDSDEGSKDENEDEEEEFDFDYESEMEEWAPPPKSTTKKKEQVKREHEESKDNKQKKGAKKSKT
jgi:hypothetical protein